MYGKDHICGLLSELLVEENLLQTCSETVLYCFGAYFLFPLVRAPPLLNFDFPIQNSENEEEFQMGFKLRWTSVHRETVRICACFLNQSKKYVQDAEIYQNTNFLFLSGKDFSGFTSILLIMESSMGGERG